MDYQSQVSTSLTCCIRQRSCSRRPPLLRLLSRPPRRFDAPRGQPLGFRYIYVYAEIWPQGSKKMKQRKFGLIKSCGVACCVAYSALSFGLPAGLGTFTGLASQTTAGNTLTINTSAARSVANWNSFSIAAGETVNIIQPSASSAMLNRVTASNPSQIHGQLTSNGAVWLINPAGIMVGPGGRVDTAAFVASTLQVTDGDFAAGRHLFFKDPGFAAAGVSNAGVITASGPAGVGGTIFLVGATDGTNPGAANTGALSVGKGGQVMLAAGQTVEIFDSTTPGVTVSITAAPSEARNLGTITADGGIVGLAGAIARNGGTINVNASTVVAEGGRIFLRASAAPVQLDSGSQLSADVQSGGGPGRVEIASAGDTMLAGSISAAGGKIAADATGNLTLASGTSIAGTDIVLRTPGVFANDAGSLAVQATNRFLIYADSPLTSNLGGLAAGNLYNCTLATCAPDGAALSGLSGNRMVWAYQPTLTITANNWSKTYGGADAPAGVAVSGLRAGDSSVDAVNLAGVTVSRGAGENVGNYTLTAAQAASSALRYAIAYADGVATITPRSLAIGALGQNRVYDGTSGALVTLTDNRIGGDNLTLSYGAASFTDGKDVGVSKLIAVTGITVSGAAAGNYTANSGTSATADITPRALSVTADAASKIYGNGVTLTHTQSGLLAGDTLSGAAVSVGQATTAGVGSYGITAGTLTAGNNYSITYTPAQLVVTPRSISVSADAQTKIYGSADPALTYAIGGSGLVNGDTLTGALARAAGETVAGGPCAINLGTLAASSNYALAYTGAALSITPAALTVAGNNQSRVFGAANPELTYRVSGLQRSDSAGDVLTGSQATAAGRTSSAGVYDITQGTLAANSNYTLGYVGAALQVTSPAVVIDTSRDLQKPAIASSAPAVAAADVPAKVVEKQNDDNSTTTTKIVLAANGDRVSRSETIGADGAKSTATTIVAKSGAIMTTELQQDDAKPAAKPTEKSGKQSSTAKVCRKT